MSSGRKRVWKSLNISQTLNKSSEGTPKRKQTKNQQNIRSLSTESSSVCNNNNWTEVFAPKTIEELALHPKKCAEIENWFSDCSNKSNSKICLITGPTGSGKTAAVHVLANKYKLQLQEWINPLDQETINSLGDQLTGEAYFDSHLTNFKSFLFRASRYKSLLDNFDKRLLLVEDFPNILLKSAETFAEILSEYVAYARSPLVFIVSDSKSRSLNISFNLFSDEVKQQYNIRHISCNPIANTLMQKAMKRFNELIQKTEVGVENYKIPPQSVIDSIILSAQGDIRNAMINFHFAALKGAPELLLTEASSNSGAGKTSRSKKSNTALKSVGRDENVTMLHALGRVFNPKYTTENIFVHSPEEIAEAFSTEPKKFLDFIHANALKHFSEIEHLVPATDCISHADVLLQEYRSDSLGIVALNIATRGLMVANKKPVSSWLPVRGPKRLQPYRSAEGITSNISALDYSTFVRIIHPTKVK